MGLPEINAESATDKKDDLTSILNSQERVELTLLVTNITAFMRKQISDTFDTPVASRKDLDQSQNHTEDESFSEKKIENETKPTESSEENPSVQELDLKRDSLGFFDKWRDSVISQINASVKVSEDITDQEIKNKLDEDFPAKPALNQAHVESVIKFDHDIFEGDAVLIKLYPPISTALYSLPQDKRALLLQAVLLVLLSLENYKAPSRILLLYLASSLHLPLCILVENEVKLAQSLLKEAEQMSGSEEVEKRSRENRFSHGWKVGLAGVVGAAVIGITGGLAAPLVAGAMGTIMGGLGLGATMIAGLLGALAQSSVVVGSLFGAYGARMTSKAVDSYAREVNDFSFHPLRYSKDQKDVLEFRRLRVTIGVSGWLTQEEDMINPWQTLGRESEVFALRWELEALEDLGVSMESVIKSAAWKVAKKEIIARTIFSSLLHALWPISLLKISKVIDNPFSICMNRADKAGAILADAIINKTQGERPLTLIGYSLGARLIYSCLISLAERRAFGLIESVVLMGTPIPSSASVWRTMRSVVSGRLVNVYSTNDYILAFLYRTWSVQYGVAGIQEINDVNGVESFDLSEMVNGHLTYQHVVGNILEKIGWENVDTEVVHKEKQALKKIEKEEENDEKQNNHSKTAHEDDDEAEKIEEEIVQKMAAI